MNISLICHEPDLAEEWNLNSSQETGEPKLTLLQVSQNPTKIKDSTHMPLLTHQNTCYGTSQKASNYDTYAHIIQLSALGDTCLLDS